MAVEHLNDSYDRCLCELRERYRGRGALGSVKTESALQEAREESTRQVAPEAYVLFDARSKIADCYRSGEYNGSKYMTSDDFVRYFKHRRSFYAPKLETQAAPHEVTVADRRRGVANGREMNRADSGKEGHLKTAWVVLRGLKEKWFPMEVREGRAEHGRFRIPAATMSGLAVFSLSLGLIVGGSVMLGNAAGKVGQMNSTIATLEAKQTELQSKLDLKYNVDEIEAEAKSLGMIKSQYADQEYITVNEEEQITIYEDGEDDKVGLNALLSAFGIELN
ncbi:MAG: hypothetical protein IJD64_05910 [Clostridia bacterium]|nr:hypothetical protein [Clostridia bacterium]